MFLIISLILWLVAAATGLTAMGQGVSGEGLKYISLIVALISIICACISVGFKKSSIGAVLIVVLNLGLAFFVWGSMIRPSMGL